jgi:hypothetical protein
MNPNAGIQVTENEIKTHQNYLSKHEQRLHLHNITLNVTFLCSAPKSSATKTRSIKSKIETNLTHLK